MKISVRHMFERHPALFPVYFSGDGGMHTCTTLADYPFMMPDRKMDFAKESLPMPWNLLSYGKVVTASSALPGHEADKANDEQVETWWAATSGKAGEWLQLDLKEEMALGALQINFADHDFAVDAPNSYVNYQYVVEASDDGKRWTAIVDQSGNAQDLPHDLHVLPAAVKCRYVRVVNRKAMDGKFSISGLRLFGNGNGKVPVGVKEISVVRNPQDRRCIRLAWDPVPDAVGYIVRWGIAGEGLHSSVVVYANEYEARYYNRDSEYHFTVEALPMRTEHRRPLQAMRFPLCKGIEVRQ